MIRLISGPAGAVALGLMLVVAWTGQAAAACTDPPTAEVNWQRCIFDGLDLQQVDLRGARLRDGSFFRANLNGSDLSGASAFKAKFFNTAMREARLDGAKLAEADFTKADLTGASMVGADLRRARFFETILRQANLTDAEVSGADFARADLSGATWTDGKRVCAEGSIGRCN